MEASGELQVCDFGAMGGSRHIQLIARGPGERDFSYFLILPFLLERMLHNQIWISPSRHRTAKGNNRILDRGIEFEQVDRESNRDNQILLTAILLTWLTGQSLKPLTCHFGK